ncbi:MAG: hypothetical protein WCP16_02280 [Pseudanabaena sp. ELA645]|jgi:hypothetical protein
MIPKPHIPAEPIGEYPDVDCCDWLRMHRLWGQLPDSALQPTFRS